MAVHGVLTHARSVSIDDESTLRKSALPIVCGVRVEVVGGPSTGLAVRSVGERLAVGSAPSNDLVLADRAVSRYHLEMTSSPYGVRVVDLGSTNGTWANGMRLHDAEVGPDTQLVLGESTLLVSRDVERAVAIHGSTALAGIVGESSVMRRTMAEICLLYTSPSPRDS